ncbi:MAG: hypothetical protein ACQETI_10845 [Halobacteriota archaeon]
MTRPDERVVAPALLGTIAIIIGVLVACVATVSAHDPTFGAGGFGFGSLPVVVLTVSLSVLGGGVPLRLRGSHPVGHGHT